MHTHEFSKDFTSRKGALCGYILRAQFTKMTFLGIERAHYSEKLISVQKLQRKYFNLNFSAKMFLTVNFGLKVIFGQVSLF